MRKIVFFTVCMLFLLAAGARADYVATLDLGSGYNPIALDNNGNYYETVGGGSLHPATLGGVTLPYVYCLGLTTTIVVPGTYYQTNVNTSGQIYDNSLQGGSPTTLNSVPNAGAVAWLLSQYAYAGATTDQQVALQAAIWHEISLGTGGTGGGYQTLGIISLDKADSSSNAYTLYGQYLIALGSSNTGTLSSFLWLSPGNGDSPVTYYQGLVTAAVPIPAAAWLLGSGLLGLVVVRRRRLGIVKSPHPSPL